jgi:hypothetical protein
METDRVFSGSISAVYDHFLGPLIFAPTRGISPGASPIFVRVGFWKLPPARGSSPALWPLTCPRL